jgi:hypothetical protein
MDTLVLNGRSLLMEYLRDHKVDSLFIAMNYIDSLTYPDSSWLTRKERFYIRFLRIDSLTLYSLEFYCSAFDFYDSSKDIGVENGCNTRIQNIATPNLWKYIKRDNFAYILEKTAQAGLPELRKKYPHFIDVWAFIDLFIFNVNPIIEEKKDQLTLFRKKFSRSPFSKLRVADLRYHQMVRGIKPKNANRLLGALLFGGSFNRIPQKPINRFNDYLAGIINFDILYGNWMVTLGGGGGSMRTIDTFSNSKDTLPALAPVHFTKFYLDIGRVKIINPQNSIISSLGLITGNISLNEDFKKKTGIQYAFPYHVGAKAGINYDYFLCSNINTMDNGALKLRFTIDVSYLNISKFAKVSNNFYGSFGILFGCIIPE